MFAYGVTPDASDGLLNASDGLSDASFTEGNQSSPSSTSQRSVFGGYASRRFEIL